MRVLLLLLALIVAVSAQFNGNGFFRIPGRRRPQQQQFRNQQQTRVRSQQRRPQQSFTNEIRQAVVDDADGSSDYHYSWRHRRGTSFTGQGARNYCRGLGNGWGPVSINSDREDRFVQAVVQGERLEYIWTGGSRQGRGFRWDDGSSVSYNNWSHTGGARRPQPDNRERSGENCLAVLNNFYRDGVKWHDVACSHRKPVICERKRG